MPPKLWFTSDTHFGHKRIIELEGRPFKTVEEMDEAIITNWNKYVTKDDIVWHLGDFAHRDAIKYLSRLNGNINICWGNHDDKCAKKIKEKFGSYQDMKYLRHEGVKIHLCHFAMRVWRSSNRGSFHLYGHSHGNMPGIGRSMDVGIMTKSWSPCSWLWEFKEILQLQDRPFTDQHEEEDDDV